MIKTFDDLADAVDGGIVLIWDEHCLVSTMVCRCSDGTLMTTDGRLVSDIVHKMNDPQIQVFDEHGKRKVID